MAVASLLLSFLMTITPPAQKTSEFSQTTGIYSTMEKILKKENKILEKEPSKKYLITPEEREMLARLCTLEAGILKLETKIMIMSVIFNRYDAGWGTLEEVVYAPRQFTPARRIYLTTAEPEAYEAVDYIINNGVTIPPYVFYFRSDFFFQWEGHVPYKKVENACFGYQINDKIKWEGKI